MITWTFKGPIAALSLITLIACEAGQGLSLSATATAQEKVPAPLSRAKMAGGVTLVAPSGFCIDRPSLEPRFAVMARCDGLGVPSASGTAPRGLITVGLTDTKSGPLPNARQIALATELENLSNIEQTEDRITFRAQGRIPVGGLSTTQWRGVARIGPFTAGVAVYGPNRGEIVTSTGRNILWQLIDRSIAASPKAAQPK